MAPGRPRIKWKDNAKMYFNEIHCKIQIPSNQIRKGSNGWVLF
jgi:hypothetical protein